MSKNLVINGVVFNGVDSIDMMTDDGSEVRYVEEGAVTPDVPGVTVAKIGDVEYDSVAKALEAAVSGDTVTMVANSAEDEILVSAAVILDLNGKQLTANYLVSFGSVVDTSNNGYGGYGKLVIAENQVLFAAENPMLPIFENDGYLFAKVRFGTKVLEKNGDTAKYQYNVYLAARAGVTSEGDLALNNLFEDGIQNNRIEVTIKISWEDAGGVYTQYFACDNDSAKVLATTSLILTVTGVGEHIDSLTFTPIAKSSTTGVEIVGTTKG